MEETILHLCMPSDQPEIEQVVEDARCFLEAKGWGGDWYALHLVLRELLLNAVRHARHEECSRDVNVVLRMLDGGGVELVVNDGGKGWDWTSHPWTLPEDTSTNGRGLYLVRSYCDSLHFNESGNTVTIRMEPRQE